MPQETNAPTHPDWLQAHVRVIGVSLTDASRDHIRQKLGQRLRKFAASIERASVRVTDVNGPRGGQDQLCRIKVVMPGLVTVLVERQHANLRAAFAAGLRAAEQAVQQRIRRARLKPMRARAPRRRGGVGGQ